MEDFVGDWHGEWVMSRAANFMWPEQRQVF
jgi:hypothetical protein